MYQPGKYIATIIDAVVGKTRGGKPQMVITIQPTHYNTGDDWEEIPNEGTRTLWLQLHGGAKEYSFKKLDSMGFNGDWNEPKFGREGGSPDFEFLCSEEERDGKRRENWDVANWGGGGSVEAAGQDVLLQLDSMWKKRKGGTPAPAGKKKQTAPPTGEVDDDNIPF